MAQIILDSNNNLIQGDFDNATLNNRTKLQTTTTNATTNVYVVPNGSSTSAGVSVANNSNLTNASKIVMATNGSTDTQIISGVNGSGTYLPLSFYTNDTLAMQVDTSQRVGIGTSNPYALLSVGPRVNQAQATTGMSVHISGANSDIFSAGNLNVNSNSSQGADIGGSIGLGGLYSTTAGGISFAQISGRKENGTDNNTSGYLSFCTRINGGNTLERMRIDSSGNVFVNTTSQIDQGLICAAYNGQAKQGIVLKDTNATLNGSYMYFINSAGSLAGQIQHNGTTTVSYVTSSDYRLKENIAPMTGALDKIAQLKPVTYTWKNTNGEQGEGFIAHELAEVCPLAVSGKKDDVNEDGSIKAQGIDTSFLVATLTAAIQEQTQIINDLKARIETLEAN